MKVKVCGMRLEDQIRGADKFDLDLMGFIFYSKSPRYVGEPETLPTTKAKKVGVFVNESLPNILKIVERYDLEFVQLHGTETAEEASQLSKEVKVIKAFSVDEDFDFTTTLPFEANCSYFLFDTKTEKYGGSGKKFNWEKLNEYKGETPFFLSGGIGPEDADELLKLDHPKFIGVDINSRFENAPGDKNLDLIGKFLNELK